MANFKLLDQFVRAPRDTGAVLPSSQSLARAVLAAAELPRRQSIVEFGPGTGVFTEHLHGMLRPDQVFFALEINPFLAQQVRARVPAAQVHTASATAIGHYLGRYGLRHCDAIVSSLPWGSLRSELQEQIFAATLDALAPGGRFVTYTYLGVPWTPAGGAFRRRLRANFSAFEQSPLVWRNFPPAMVYACTR